MASTAWDLFDAIQSADVGRVRAIVQEDPGYRILCANCSPTAPTGPRSASDPYAAYSSNA